MVGDLVALEAALVACGVVLSEPVVQDDQAYARVGWDYGQSKIGAFLEIERIVHGGESGERVQSELDRFAVALDAPLRRTNDTYDSLIRAAGMVRV